MTEKKQKPAANPPAPYTAEERAEEKKLAKLSDDQILEMSSHGKLGPGILGRPLYDRAASIIKAGGMIGLGPAIMDPDYHAKQLALRERERAKLEKKAGGTSGTGKPPAGSGDGKPGDLVEKEGEVDPKDLTDKRNPWAYVQLGGAKRLAQVHQVSHKPRVTRVELIEQLQAAKVEPPPVPTDADQDDDDDEER
jgi:hypothetical protein